MTQTGLNWLLEQRSKQSEWFQKKLLNWVERVHGTTDHSADFCSPFFYVLAVTVSVGNFFCAALTTFFGWIVAIAQDCKHFSHDPAAAAASLFCITPLYVIFMTIAYLLACILCIVVLVVMSVVVILVALCFGIYYVAEKCLNGVGNIFGRIFKTAAR